MKYKKGDQVTIYRLLEESDNESIMKDWLSRIGTVCITDDGHEDRDGKIQYALYVNTKYIGSWLEDELINKNQIVTEILKDL